MFSSQGDAFDVLQDIAQNIQQQGRLNISICFDAFRSRVYDEVRAKGSHESQSGNTCEAELASDNEDGLLALPCPGI